MIFFCIYIWYMIYLHNMHIYIYIYILCTCAHYIYIYIRICAYTYMCIYAYLCIVAVHTCIRRNARIIQIHNILVQYTYIFLRYIIWTSLTPHTTFGFVCYSDDSMMQMMLCKLAASLESSFAHIVFVCPWCEVHGRFAIQVIYLRERVKQAAHRQHQGSPGAATKCRLKNG